MSTKTKDPTRGTREYLERLKQRTYSNVVPLIYGSTYYWIYGWTKGGKNVLWGPKLSSIEADRELATLEDGEIFELETRNVTRATSEIKAQLMERGGDPDEALKRLIHKKDVE